MGQPGRQLPVLHPRLRRSHQICQPEPHVQEPCGYRLNARRKDHNRQHREMELGHVEDGADPADKSCHQPGHRLLPLLDQALHDQRSERHERAPDLLFREPLHGAQVRMGQWRERDQQHQLAVDGGRSEQVEGYA